MEPLYEKIYHKAAEIRKISDRLGGVEATFEAMRDDQTNRWENPSCPPNPKLIPMANATHELKDLLLEVRPPEWLIKTHYDDTIAAIENLEILENPERSQQWAIMDEHTPIRRSQIIDEAVGLIGQSMRLDRPVRFGQYKNWPGYGMELITTPKCYEIWPNQSVGEKEASKQTAMANFGAFEQHIPLLCHELSHTKQIQLLNNPNTPQSDYIDLLRFQMASRFALIGNQTSPVGALQKDPEPAFYLLSHLSFKDGYEALPQEMGADYSRMVAAQQISKILGKRITIQGENFEKLLQWAQHPQEINGSEGIK